MSVPAGFVEALWVGSYEAQMVDGTVLCPGETTAVIPEGEALTSDNWKLVPVAKPVEPKPKENAE